MKYVLVTLKMRVQDDISLKQVRDNVVESLPTIEGFCKFEAGMACVSVQNERSVVRKRKARK